MGLILYRPEEKLYVIGRLARMKVYIGPYKNWFGPHQLAEKLCFWAKKDGVHREYPEYVFKLGEWLAHGSWRGVDAIPQSKRTMFINDEPETWLYRLMQWYDKKKERKVKIRIDKYDTYSMDNTLALIILPMLKQLKETKHGSTIVDDEDLPEHMRTVSSDPWDDQMAFDFYHEEPPARYANDVHDKWDWVLDEMIWAFECLNDDDKTWIFEKEEEKRMEHALMMFGKYFRGLWD